MSITVTTTTITSKYLMGKSKWELTQMIMEYVNRNCTERKRAIIEFAEEAHRQAQLTGLHDQPLWDKPQQIINVTYAKLMED